MIHRLGAVQTDGPPRSDSLVLLPAVTATVVAGIVGYYAVASPVGSTATSTYAFVGAVVATTAVGGASAVLGRDVVALVATALLVVIGGVGFALGPQLWLVAALLGLSTMPDRQPLSFGLVGVVGLLAALTVLTSDWHRTATLVVAVSVTGVAALTAFVGWKRRTPPG